MRRLYLFLILVLSIPFHCHAQFSPAGRAYVEFIARASHSDYSFNLGEQAYVRVDAIVGGKPLEAVCVFSESGMEMMAPDRRDTLTFTGGHVDIPVGTSYIPGFRACSFSFEVEGKIYKDMLKLAFSPEEIQTLTPMPSDFREFWGKAVKDAEGVPLNPQITPLPKYSTEKVEVFLVELTVGPAGRTMYGYLTKPKAPGRYPVLFCPPGAGANKISPSTYYSENGYIYFNVCVHDGLNPELPDAEYVQARKIADNYTYNGIEDPERFYYKTVYAGCSRCVDFLCTLPEWDGKNVGVTGGSQGGALTVITAALNRKVTFSSAFYPALCDLCGFLHGRAGGWPKYFLTPDGKDHSAEERTLSYYDVVNFGRILESPLFLSFGFSDNSCSPTAAMALKNVISAPLTVEIAPNSAHWRYGEVNSHAMQWQRKMMYETR